MPETTETTETTDLAEQVRTLTERLERLERTLAPLLRIAPGLVEQQRAADDYADDLRRYGADPGSAG